MNATNVATSGNKTGPTISWVILTYNRRETVTKAIDHCMANAGAKWDEIVWVDNGSTDGMENTLFNFEPDVAVLNNTNLGVAKGYNRGMALATKDYIVITGCDMKMPNNWLRTFKEYVEHIPQTGVACMYSRHWTEKPERIRKFGIDDVHGLPIVHAMPIERRIFRRDLLADFGYLPETFGLYGVEDLCWAYRAEKVCAEKGLLTYVIPGFVAEHLGTEGVNKADGKDSFEYHAFKQKEVQDASKLIEFERLRDLGWPKSSPYP